MLRVVGLLCCAGVRAARAAGIPVFGITSGQEPAVLWEAGCCMLVKDFTELVALAGQHCQAAAAVAGNGGGVVQQQEQLQGKDRAAATQPQFHITADSRQ